MANLFLDASELLQQADSLNYINYENISESDKEFLASNVWDWTWTKPAAAVYFPGNNLLHKRLRSVQPQFPNQLGTMTAIIRQFQINQQTFSGTTSGQITMDFTDREDQAINAWLDDWRDKIGGRENRYSFRKEDWTAEGVLTLFNSSRKPIRKLQCFGVQLMDPGQGLNPPLTSDDAQNIGEISATWSFEHFKLIWSNME